MYKNTYPNKWSVSLSFRRYRAQLELNLLQTHIQKSQINYKYMGTHKLNRICFISEVLKLFWRVHLYIFMIYCYFWIILWILYGPKSLSLMKMRKWARGRWVVFSGVMCRPWSWKKGLNFLLKSCALEESSSELPFFCYFHSFKIIWFINSSVIMRLWVFTPLS